MQHRKSVAAAVCAPTGFIRDGIDLTAAVIDASALTGTVNATGCDIGVYYHPGTSGSVNLAWHASVALNSLL